MKQIAIITIIIALTLNYAWIKEINQIVNYISRENQYNFETVELNYSAFQLIQKAVCKEYDKKTVAFVWGVEEHPLFQNMPYAEAISFPCDQKIRKDYFQAFTSQKNLIIIGDK